MNGRRRWDWALVGWGLLAGCGDATPPAPSPVAERVEVAGMAPPWTAPPLPEARELATSDAERLELAHTHAMAALARMRGEIDCATSGWRIWCPAMGHAGAPIPAGTLPSGARYARHGLVYNLRQSDPVELAAERTTTIGALVIEPGPDGAMRAGVDVYLTRSAGASVLSDVAATLAGYMKGQFPDIVLLRSALSLLHGTPQDAGVVVEDAHGAGWVGTWPARLYWLPDLVDGQGAWVWWRDMPQGGFLGIFPALEAQIVTRPGDPPSPASSFPVEPPPPPSGDPSVPPGPPAGGAP